jgi:hypothetical protein
VTLSSFAATVAATNGWWFFRGHGPQPLTEPVVVKTGTWDGKRWQLVAFRAAEDGIAFPAGVNGICYGVMPYASPPSASTGGALACGGFSVRRPGSPGAPRGINYGSAQSAELPLRAAGPVVDTAAEVAIYFRNGGILRVPTFAAPASLGHIRFYATRRFQRRPSQLAKRRSRSLVSTAAMQSSRVRLSILPRRAASSARWAPASSPSRRPAPSRSAPSARHDVPGRRDRALSFQTKTW